MQGLTAEGVLAVRHELTMEQMAGLRQGLEETEHWVLRTGKVFYTTDGAAEIAGLAEDFKKKAAAGTAVVTSGEQDVSGQGPGPQDGGKGKAAAPDAEKNGGEPRKTNLIIVRVFPNPIWVDCRKKEAPANTLERWRCRVTFNRRMRAGQALDGCLDEGDHFVYPRRIAP